jgi:hypothetical protein
MTENLKAAIKNGQAILFAGAGVSAALGAPTWGQLIEHIGDDLGFEKDVFSTLSDSYLTLAEYYKIQTGSIGPLRSWMDRSWSFSDDTIKRSEIHKYIADLNFPIIYTTNYDRNIERALRLHGKEARRILNVKDLIKVEGNETQVIKLHGDFDDDDSIVLTETDYFKRLSFDSPLDIRLRSDVLARPVLFIGYSLSDINVRILLHKLWETWDSSPHRSQKPEIYIFLPRPNEVEEAVLAKWGVTTLVGDDPDPAKALESFLAYLAS